MAATNPKFLEYKNQGNEAFKNKDYNKAIALFTKCVEIDSKDYIIYSNRSACYASLEQYDKALADADCCIRIKPDWAKGYSRRGLALHHLGKTDEATKTYNLGLKYDPDNKALKEGLESTKSSKGLNDIQVMMSCFQAVEGNPKLKKYAEEDAEYVQKLTGIVQMIRENPRNLSTVLRDPDPRLREGVMAVFGGQSKEEEDPQAPPPPKNPEAPKKPERTQAEKNADSHKDKGNELYKKKQFTEALAEYDKAIEINPLDITYNNNKAAVYMEMKEFDKCISECQSALERRYETKAGFAKVAKVYNRMSSCYERQGDLDKAIEMFEKSLLEDNNRHTRNALRDLQRARDKKSKDAYQDPVKAEQHKEKGNELFKAGDYPAAKLEYDEAIRRNVKDSKLYGNRAAALTKLGELPTALKDCDTALELDPKFVKCWIRKANLHFAMKENTKAINACNKALEIDNANEEARQTKAKIYMKIQQTASSSEIDEEQQRHAMADPEIQNILGDPQFQLILKKIQENPSSLQEYMRDAKIADAITKLMSAGILRTA